MKMYHQNVFHKLKLNHQIIMYISIIFSFLFIKYSFEQKLPSNYSASLQIHSEQYYSSIPCILNYCETLFDKKSSSPNLMVIMPITSSPFQIEILNNLFNTYNYDTIIINAKINFLSNFIVEKNPNNYLILIDNINELMQMEKLLIQLNNVNPLTPVIIIFTKIYSTYVDEVNLVFQRLLTLNFYNVYGIVIKSNSTEVLTWYPYENKNCAKIVNNIKIISICYGSAENIALINQSFDEKMKRKISDRNLNKCSLKIAVRVWEPYVMQNVNHSFNGIDKDLIKYVAESLNVIPEYYSLTKKKQDFSKDLIQR